MPSYTEGNFTVTATGFAGTVSGTARYVKIGNHVTLYLPALTGTSNTTTLTLTGVPAALMATVPGSIKISALDNGLIDTLTVLSVDTMTAYRNPSGTVVWTASGIKGFYAQHVAYLVG